MSDSPVSLAFRVQIACDNAAFEDNATREIARMLREIAQRLEAGESCDTFRSVADANGNTVGYFALKPRAAF